MTLIYSPKEDSYLLSEVLKKEISILLSNNRNLNCLEVGVGSGIQLITLKDLGVKKEKIFGVDINSNAVKYCKNLGFRCIKSDLFKNVKGKFDLILFNPPYLPKVKGEDKESELITTGGKSGSRVINEFLFQAKNHLNNGGLIFILISSLTKGVNWLDYNKILVGEKSIFFEKLEVWKLSL